ncbi:hypothetical protein ATANTOWER_030973, partial [Ataeniobius toweri]|nr:hypothetical protein [Ataeniobius toweri]
MSGYGVQLGMFDDSIYLRMKWSSRVVSDATQQKLRGRRSQCKTLQTSSHIYAPCSTVRQQGANWTMMDYRSALLFLIICFM